MNLRTYLRAIRKRWWLVLLVTVLGTAAGAAALVTATPVYVSAVTFYVATSASTDSGSAAFSADQFAQRRATSYAELLSSDKVAKAILAGGTVDMPVRALASEISGAVDVNTVLLVATVHDADKERALAIGQALATEFGPLITELDSTVSLGTSVSLSVVSGPTVPTVPVSPRRSVYLGLGLLAGLLVGLLAAAARDRFDTTIRTDESLAEVSSSPVLASVPLDPAARTSPLIWGDRARSRRAEAYRRLRTNLQFADVDEPIKVVVVTSALAEEGKSSTAANMALSFAEAGRKVVLVEADLRRPRVADYFDVERVVGLTNVLAGQVELSHALQPWGNTGLYLLPSGSLPPNPSELLGSRNMVELVARLKERFEIVVIDSPPLLPVTDAAVVSVLAGGVVFVVRHGKTKRAQVADSLQALEAVDARLLGFVLNRVPSKRGSKGYTTYGDYGTYDRGAGLIDAIDVNADLSNLGSGLPAELGTAPIGPVSEGTSRSAP